MVRSVEDASILMGVISDVNLEGCDLNLATCLGNQVENFLQQKKSFCILCHATPFRVLKLVLSETLSGIL